MPLLEIGSTYNATPVGEKPHLLRRITQSGIPSKINEFVFGKPGTMPEVQEQSRDANVFRVGDVLVSPDQATEQKEISIAQTSMATHIDTVVRHALIFGNEPVNSTVSPIHGRFFAELKRLNPGLNVNDSDKVREAAQNFFNAQTEGSHFGERILLVMAMEDWEKSVLQRATHIWFNTTTEATRPTMGGNVYQINQEGVAQVVKDAGKPFSRVIGAAQGLFHAHPTTYDHLQDWERDQREQSRRPFNYIVSHYDKNLQLSDGRWTIDKDYKNIFNPGELQFLERALRTPGAAIEQARMQEVELRLDRIISARIDLEVATGRPVADTLDGINNIQFNTQTNSFEYHDGHNPYFRFDSTTTRAIGGVKKQAYVGADYALQQLEKRTSETLAKAAKKEDSALSARVVDSLVTQYEPKPLTEDEVAKKTEAINQDLENLQKELDETKKYEEAKKAVDQLTVEQTSFIASLGQNLYDLLGSVSNPNSLAYKESQLELLKAKEERYNEDETEYASKITQLNESLGKAITAKSKGSQSPQQLALVDTIIQQLNDLLTRYNPLLTTTLNERETNRNNMSALQAQIASDKTIIAAFPDQSAVDRARVVQTEFSQKKAELARCESIVKQVTSNPNNPLRTSVIIEGEITAKNEEKKHVTEPDAWKTHKHEQYKTYKEEFFSEEKIVARAQRLDRLDIPGMYEFKANERVHTKIEFPLPYLRFLQIVFGDEVVRAPTQESLRAYTDLIPPQLFFALADGSLPNTVFDVTGNPFTLNYSNPDIIYDPLLNQSHGYEAQQVWRAIDRKVATTILDKLGNIAQVGQLGNVDDASRLDIDTNYANISIASLESQIKTGAITIDPNIVDSCVKTYYQYRDVNDLAKQLHDKAIIGGITYQVAKAYAVEVDKKRLSDYAI